MRSLLINLCNARQVTASVQYSRGVNFSRNLAGSLPFHFPPLSPSPPPIPFLPFLSPSFPSFPNSLPLYSLPLP